MSFSAEMKDFLNAYKTGQSINASRTDQDYKEASTDAMKKKTERDNDPEALQLETDTKKQQLSNLKSSAGTSAMNAQTQRMSVQDQIKQREWLRSQAAGTNGSGLLPPGAINPQAGATQPSPGALPIGPSTLDDGTEAYADGGLVPRADPREGAADVRRAYQDLRETPPVTIMEDVVGRFNEHKGQSNALRDAVREKAFKDIKDHPDVSDMIAAQRHTGRYYADGGLVDEDTDPNDEDDQGAIPLNAPATAPTDVSARARQPAVPKGLEGVVSPALVADATKAGMTFGINQYGLNGTGGVPSARSQANARLFAQGHGGLTDQEMQAARDAVDPDKKLTDSQRNMAALGSVYQFWANKGEGEKAQRVAFQMLQHFRNATQRYAAIAAKAAEGGNVDLATKAAMKAYANVPDGQDLELLPNPDGGIMYAVTGPNGDVVTKGIATPQQLAASAMGLATGGFDKAILSAAGAAENTGAVKPGGAGKAQSTNDRAKEADITGEAVNKLKDKWVEKNKGAPVDDEFWQQTTDTAQHILQQNPKANASEAARAAQLLISPGSKDPEKPDFKVKMGEEGQPHTVTFGSGLKIKLDDDQLDTINNARAARVKLATDKISADTAAGDTPSRTDQAIEGAKQVGKGVLDITSGGPMGMAARGAAAVGSKALDALKSIYGEHIPQSVVDAVQGTLDEGKARYGSAASHIGADLSNKGAIPVDDGDRPL